MPGKTRGRGNRPTFTDQEALLFHSQGRPGKLEVVATKPMATQRDLSLAYSPGVAVPVLAHRRERSAALTNTPPRAISSPSLPTARRSSASAICGALAAKPVMEGKAVLFKRFADIDSIDLEVRHRGRRRVHQLRQAARHQLSAASISRTSRPPNASSSSSGCANCSTFRYSTTTSTAPRSSPSAGLINALDLTGRDIANTQASCATAPAPPASPASSCCRASACRPENVILCDTKGVIYEGRTEGMNQWKSAHRGRRPRSARWPMRWRAPTCSSACRSRARSPRRW